MAWPFDYFLPAKSFLVDTPVAGDILFYRIMREQMEGLRLMANERIALVNVAQPFSPLTILPSLSDPLNRLASTIALYQWRIGQIAAACVNTDIYAEGNITGAFVEGVSVCWTLATVLSSISGGVGGNWTRVPARNPWGYSAAGGYAIAPNPVLPGSGLCYVEQINELYKVLQKCTHFFSVHVGLYGTQGIPKVKDATGGTTYLGKHGDAATKALAEVDYSACGYMNLGNPQMTTDEDATLSFYQLTSQPGTYFLDLTGFSGGTTKIFFGIAATWTGGLSPPVDADGVYHLESEQVNGGTYLTAACGADSQPAWQGVKFGGWILRCAAVVSPTLTYT